MKQIVKNIEANAIIAKHSLKEIIFLYFYLVHVPIPF